MTLWSRLNQILFGGPKSMALPSAPALSRGDTDVFAHLDSGRVSALVEAATSSLAKPVEPPSGEAFLARYVRTGTPVHIKGLVRDWPAVDLWTPDFLLRQTEAMGDIQVSYRSTPSEMSRVDLNKIQQGIMSLSSILKECVRSPTDGPEIYVPGLDLPPGALLNRDLAQPALLAAREIYATTVFLGRNTKCIGHFHPKSQALLCQVHGVKRVWMYPPAELRRLNLFPVWTDGFFRSQVNFYGDLSAFPGVAKARGHLFELQPGDALFIPLHWLHVPEGEGWSVSVTHWWRPTFREWTWGLASARALFGIGFELARQLRRKRL